jgi:hypothetical protein
MYAAGLPDETAEGDRLPSLTPFGQIQRQLVLQMQT